MRNPGCIPTLGSVDGKCKWEVQMGSATVLTKLPI